MKGIPGFIDQPGARWRRPARQRAGYEYEARLRGLGEEAAYSLLSSADRSLMCSRAIYRAVLVGR